MTDESCIEILFQDIPAKRVAFMGTMAGGLSIFVADNKKGRTVEEFEEELEEFNSFLFENSCCRARDVNEDFEDLEDVCFFSFAPAVDVYHPELGVQPMVQEHSSMGVEPTESGDSRAIEWEAKPAVGEKRKLAETAQDVVQV